MAPTASITQERGLLEAARGGDEDAFRGLVELHHADLHAHCYRMLGSVHDAEDALQEALLRAWRGLPRFEGRSAPRSWLYRIATNTCLDSIARRRKRVLPIDYGPPADAGDDPGEPLGESVWVEPYPDERFGVEDGYAAPEARYEQREAVELAFIAALQHLPPRQRAALILRDVLGLSAREVAEALETTVASVNSALQRARKAVEERLPARSQQATLRSLGDERIRALVERFIDAFERGEVDAILALLAEDATFAMPPYASWYRGRDAVAESWLMPGGPPPRLRYVPTRANGQPAVGTYYLDPEAGSYLPIALDVFTLRGAEIAEVIAFRTPDIFRRFGLPDELDAAREA
jgi:RNA polymerase sigma-70 factor, ECF subfamily